MAAKLKARARAGGRDDETRSESQINLWIMDPTRANKRGRIDKFSVENGAERAKHSGANAPRNHLLLSIESIIANKMSYYLIATDATDLWFRPFRRLEFGPL